MTVGIVQTSGSKPLRASAAASHSPGMLFSLSVEDSPLVTAAHNVHLQAQLSLLESSLQPLLQARGPWHRKLLREVHFYRDILLAEDDDVDGVVLASKLTLSGYRVAVRQALGGGQGTAVFSNLRHSFLLVTAPQGCPCAGVDFIVEPHFRSQFEIPQPTPRYSGLLSMVPAVFVGTAAELLPLVQLLCSEMTLAFEEHGLSLPPWRQSKSLLSKWLPSKLRDYDLLPYASPHATSPELLFPLSCVAGAAQHGGSHPVSESVSGSITPAFSGGEDEASPRAVLRCASAVLLGHQNTSAGTPPVQGATGEQPVPAPCKSLLSSSLAATGKRGFPERQCCHSGRNGAAPAAAQPLPPQQQHQLGSSASIRHSGGGGMAYRISSEWQQPAIRTVKMQGHVPAAASHAAA